MIFLVQLGFSDPYVFKGIALFYEEFAEMKSSLQGPTFSNHSSLYFKNHVDFLALFYFRILCAD